MKYICKEISDLKLTDKDGNVLMAFSNANIQFEPFEFELDYELDSENVDKI